MTSSSGWAWTRSNRRDGLTRPSCYAAVPPLLGNGSFAPRFTADRGAELPLPRRLQDLEGFRVVAAVGVADAAVLQRRLLVDAQLPLVVAEHVRELLAAGAELAAGRRVRRARDVATDDDPLALTLTTRVGQRDR